MAAILEQRPFDSLADLSRLPAVDNGVIAALVAVTDEPTRKALVESWKGQTAAATKPAKSEPLYESLAEFPKDSDEFVRLLKR